jgi:hypothetical protein
MKNRILDVVIVDHRLDPVETELRVYVKLEQLTSAVEIRGKLAGPRCPYASTIEIAYPLREVERTDHIELRVVIPEPSWWDPESPFLYEGTIELAEDGVFCERRAIRHGIRRIQLTAKGLRVNGKPYALCGQLFEGALTDSNALELREAGVNTLVAKVDEAGIGMWDSADRLGFFVLGTTNDLACFLEHRNDLATHPSTFGWIFNRADFLAGPSEDETRSFFYGVNTSARSCPPNADFLVCQESELAWLDDVELPKLVVTSSKAADLTKRNDVIGVIDPAKA